MNIIALSKHNPQIHLTQQGIKTVRDLQHKLQEVFEEAEHQDSVIVKLYRLFFPDWENIKRIEGFPEVGPALWTYICNLFIEFDRVHHPEYLKGGAWINWGFASSDKLEPWGINLTTCKVIYI